MCTPVVRLTWFVSIICGGQLSPATLPTPASAEDGGVPGRGQRRPLRPLRFPARLLSCSTLSAAPGLCPLQNWLTAAILYSVLQSVQWSRCRAEPSSYLALHCVSLPYPLFPCPTHATAAATVFGQQIQPGPASLQLQYYIVTTGNIRPANIAAPTLHQCCLNFVQFQTGPEYFWRQHSAGRSS